MLCPCRLCCCDAVVWEQTASSPGDLSQNGNEDLAVASASHRLVLGMDETQMEQKQQQPDSSNKGNQYLKNVFRSFDSSWTGKIHLDSLGESRRGFEVHARWQHAQRKELQIACRWMISGSWYVRLYCEFHQFYIHMLTYNYPLSDTAEGYCTCVSPGGPAARLWNAQQGTNHFSMRERDFAKNQTFNVTYLQRWTVAVSLTTTS